MKNEEKNSKELLFLKAYDSEIPEEETVKRLAQLLKSLGFNIIDEEDN